MTTDSQSHPPGEPADDGPASAASRRAFLLGTGAVAGAGALGAVVVGAGQADAGNLPASGPSEPIVAYVRDVAAGEISVLHGDHEVVVTDHSLARALARKAR